MHSLEVLKLVLIVKLTSLVWPVLTLSDCQRTVQTGDILSPLISEKRRPLEQNIGKDLKTQLSNP